VELIELQQFPSSGDETRDAMRTARRQQLERRFADEFARSRGWQLSERPFSLGQLGRQSNKAKAGEAFRQFSYGFEVTDRAVYYRESGNPHRPAGIVVHVTNWEESREAIEAACRTFKLECIRVLNFPAWLDPENVRLVLYTPASAKPKPAPTAVKVETLRGVERGLFG
jgi:hypothetical protein